MTQTPCEDHGRIRCSECAWIEELKERAIAAEAREQRLKETMERLKKITDEEAEAKHHTMTIALRQKIIDQALSTLYPDTPRGFTDDEAEAHKQVIKNRSASTGINLYPDTPAPKEGE